MHVDAPAFDACYTALKRLTSSLNSPDPHLVVAFSGGVDSTLLLLAARQLCAAHHYALSAVHVHHGLSPHADDWQVHCQALCERLDVALETISVTLEARPRQSLEALARTARYEALLRYCKAHNGVLLLGHHAQDQLETLLLQLKRGAGPKGLAGMGEVQARDGITLWRPLLALQRAQIEDAVQRAGIEWVEDESNHNDDFDRNFVRNQVLPVLLERWPQLTKTVARSASLCAEQTAMIEEEGRARLAGMTAPDGQLELPGLRQQSASWQRVILRCWLNWQGIPGPAAAQLAEIQAMLDARDDAQPQVQLGQHWVRRFADALYAVSPQPAPPERSQVLSVDSSVSMPWLGISVVLRTSGLRTDKWRLETGMPAVRIKPAGQRVSKPLKQWLKQWQVPVWERSAVTVILYDGTPAAVLTKEADIVLEDFSKQLEIKRKKD